MYSEIAANKRKTFFVFIAFLALVMGLSWLAGIFLTGDTSFTPIISIGFFIGSVIYALVMYFAGAKMATAVNGAKEIQKRDNPRLFRIVENLAITEGMPMPRVFIMEDPALNAFATGRDPKHAIVCATTGLLDALNDQELEGVMAHEMGHVKNYDIRVSMFAFGLVSVVSLIADLIFHFAFFSDNDERHPLVYVLGIAAAIIAPISASLIQLAISRQREYLADATGALTTRHPEGLASALEKISQQGSFTRRANSSTAHLFFANPLKGRGLAALFSTHPPAEQRIARLRKMGHHG
jgi:heat shock protein HtpX